MVDPDHAGRVIGKKLGLHSLREASRLSRDAIQLRVSTSTSAVNFWKKLGFAIVGTLPKAFQHREQGLVDAYVMRRFLGDIDV
jgi:ribosomal protein S18 acetylase RimI-like enzyme